jgi:tryptophan halogenase
MVKNVVIVGGGSSAWLTAAYLTNQCAGIKFTVIDKEIGNPIGVGEGTLLSFQSFMKDCGFDKSEWFHKIDATYKCGALFPDWVEDGNIIWHPFAMSYPIDDNNTFLQSAWSRHQSYDFKHYGLGLYETTVRHNKIDSSLIDAYAYHVDCGKLVQFIQNKLKDRISFIASDVVELHKDGDNIKSLKLANGAVVEADLFIDCTGFKSILRTESDKVNLIGRVFCDTAVCSQIQYVDKESEQRPYTRAQAVEHGWIWTIPTQSRMGSGMIFNKQVTDIEEAKDYLVSYWGEDRLSRDKIRVIDWTPFYLKDPWKANVVCVGMSAGFIEPLESTGLALVQYEVYNIANVIKDNIIYEESIESFNKQFKLTFEDCVDFVSSHYSKTNRTGKFWNYVKHTYKHTEKILAIIELLKDGPRHGSQKHISSIFGGSNWTTWMYQLGYELGEDTSISKEYAEYLLLKQYNTVEKYRPNWSQLHSTELMRSKEYDNYCRKD